MLEYYAWGKEWSPIVIGDTGTIIVPVYYPHKAGGDAFIGAKGHPVRCLICDEDMPGTKPHTKRALRQAAILGHLKSHGRRTKRRNKFIASLMVA